MTSRYPPPLGDPAPGSQPAPRGHPMVLPEALVPAARGASVFLSASVRAGDWILPRLFRAVCFMGDLTLDLTNARLGAGSSHIELVVIMGNVTVLIPPDVRVECDGDPILGSFELKGLRWSATAPDAPTVRVTGTVFMGSVQVKVVDPNAPSWIEKMRSRWAGTRNA